MFNPNIPTIARGNMRAIRNQVLNVSRKGWLPVCFTFLLAYVLLSEFGLIPYRLLHASAASLGGGQRPHPFDEGGLAWWESLRYADVDLGTEGEQVYAAGIHRPSVPSNERGNLGFLLQAKAQRAEQAKAQRAACQAYIQRFAKTAQEEAQRYNIPASITLAQALWASNAGEGKDARNLFNHFNVPCLDKNDPCQNNLRAFQTAWESFRAHSKLLCSKRYKHLQQLPRSDYRNWAYGLKAAGYAKDKDYAEQLIRIIEQLKLNQYDK